jgi:hypothetical protein
MTHCPQCGEFVNPLRLLLVNRWVPYRCRRCWSEFQRVVRLREVVVYSVVGISALLAHDMFGITLPWAIGGAWVIAFLLDWRVMRWEKVVPGRTL